MYEALVARVRYHIQKANFMGLKEAESTLLLVEAADAIEELSRDLDSMNEANIALYGALPHWIPVTERLPESRHEYVLCCGAKGGQFVGWVATKTYDGGDKASAYVHGGQGRSITHWMPLPQPPKEET